MIQIEKVIERGSEQTSVGHMEWFKFADGTYLLGGGLEWETTTPSNRYTFYADLPISVTEPYKAVTVATNRFNSRQICTWSATMSEPSRVRFDVEPADNTGTGVLLCCSFILLGK